ncbi:MAG TPA: hypothetical protein VMZ50_02145 [Phycisphaerae bacterium]|nr:hypothetical protein [Phycisphaerae bacterium]
MVEELYESRLAGSVEALQDAGHNVYIWGFSADGRYALVVNADADQVSVAPLAAVNGLGRWECSKAHLADSIGLYAERFPLR